MRGFILFLLFFFPLYAKPFSVDGNVSIGELPLCIDKMGRPVYEVNITTQTRNYHVATLLAKPVKKGKNIEYKKGANIDEILSKASLHVAVDGDSPVYDENLSQNGGSGERPFLLPFEAQNMQEGDEKTFWFEVVDNNAPAFDPSDEEKFYPLDVERSITYTTAGSAEECKGFFGFFACAIDRFFQKTVGKAFFGHATDSFIDHPLKRKKYLANIFYGIEKDRSIHEEDSVDTSIPAVNTPISLLHYEEISGQGCKAGFPISFNFGSDSLVCKFIKTFSFEKWVPFVEVSDTKLDYHRIQEDTKLTLLTLMGYKNQKREQDFFTYFMQQLLKPMHQFFSLFFPYTQPTVSPIVDRNITTDKPILLSLPVVSESGDRIGAVRSFRLLALHQSVVQKIDRCQKRFAWGFITGPWEDTDFVECKRFIDQAVEDATGEDDISILQHTIEEFSQLFDFFFPKYQYRGGTTTYTKLGITLKRHDPSLFEGNPVVVSTKYSVGKGK